jgi:hypothetical protein
MMGKPDTLDRIVQALIALVALFAMANGALMLADPFGWYQAVGTVRFTGPPNAHFIRDIGIAYAVSGIVLGFAAMRPAMRWLAAVAGNLWLTLHGALHIWEVTTGVCAPDIFWRDAPGVLGPPMLVWVALGILFARARIAPAGVPRIAYLKAVEAIAPGESAYVLALAAAPGGALEKFKHLQPATMHRHAAPADAFHMARIGATLVEDCGPCALTAAKGALADGLPRDLVNAALAGTPPEGELATAFAFGQAIARQSADASALGDAIEARFGKDARLELAMTAATVRAYPAMKRGLGLTTSCSITKLDV